MQSSVGHSLEQEELAVQRQHPVVASPGQQRLVADLVDVAPQLLRTATGGTEDFPAEMHSTAPASPATIAAEALATISS